MQAYNSSLDPVNNTTPLTGFYHLRSTTKGGAGAGILGTDDLVIPASPNFPAQGTATRYFLYMPMLVDMTDLVTRPFTVRNETGGYALTRVAQSASLTSRTYKIFDATSKRRAVIEVHVGVGSSQPSDVISFEGYFEGTQLDENYFYKNMVIATPTTLTLKAGYYHIVMIGGGGGGGCGNPAGGGHGGGGGSGGIIDAVVSLAGGSYTITLGAAGTAGIRGGTEAGGNGGDTRFSGTDLDFTALGGSGGDKYAGGVSGVGGRGGAGGTLLITGVEGRISSYVTGKIMLASIRKQDGFTGSTTGGRGGGILSGVPTLAGVAGIAYGDGGSGGAQYNDGGAGKAGAVFIESIGGL